MPLRLAIAGIATAVTARNIDPMSKAPVDMATLTALSPEERLQLIGELWDSLSVAEIEALAPISVSFGDELERRARAVREGTEPLISLDEALRRAQAADESPG